MAGWADWAKRALFNGTDKAAHHVGIYGFDGTCWGATDDVAGNLPQGFIQEAAKILENGIGAGKLVLDNQRYITIRVENDAVIAKLGSGGISVCKGARTYLFSIYDNEEVSQNTNYCAACQTRQQLKDMEF